MGAFLRLVERSQLQGLEDPARINNSTETASYVFDEILYHMSYISDMGYVCYISKQEETRKGKEKKLATPWASRTHDKLIAQECMHAFVYIPILKIR